MAETRFNALRCASVTRQLRLSRAFRFGPRIAHVADLIKTVRLIMLHDYYFRLSEPIGCIQEFAGGKQRLMVAHATIESQLNSGETIERAGKAPWLENYFYK